MTATLTLPVRKKPESIFLKLARKIAGMVGATIPVSEERRRQTFNEIMRDYDNMISRICFSYSRTTEEFEDLRQDTYINIWQGLSNFRGESAVKTWVYRITLNTCVSILRKRKNEGNRAELTDFADLIDEATDHRALLNDMYQAISRLPQIDKAIVLMWLDENSYDEIAEVMGLSRNNVAVRLHRAKQTLKII